MSSCARRRESIREESRITRSPKVRSTFYRETASTFLESRLDVDVNGLESTFAV